MSHHDVVDVEGEWSYPPFSGEEELLKEGWLPPCNVYLVSSHNEEVAGNGVPLALERFKENQIAFEWMNESKTISGVWEPSTARKIPNGSYG